MAPLGSRKTQRIHSGSIAAMIRPRVIRKRVMLASDSPCSCRRRTLSCITYPARKTNVGAQRWVIHRVRNWASGSGVPGR